MGIPLSLLGKLGIPGANSLSTNQVYDKYFRDPQIKEFQEFHVAFIKLCKDFNEIMPGRHYALPEFEEIRKFYDEWKKATNDEAKKDKFNEFLKNNVKERKVSDKATMVAGLVAPAAAVVLKKSTDSLPQVKKFKLHLVPNFVFVPGSTLLVLIGMRVLQMSKTRKP